MTERADLSRIAAAEPPSEERAARGPSASHRAPPSVLLVEDDEPVARFFARALSTSGYEVVRAASAEAATEQLGRRSFDVILTDIALPGTDGIELMRLVRRYDLDVPIVLVTGMPDATTAIEAVRYGALRYLVKPVGATELLEVVGHAVRVRRLAAIKREAIRLLGERAREASDRAGLEVSFERALDGLHMVYQPIVSWTRKAIEGFEALVRSGEPALARPDVLFEAAERLGQLHRLGRAIRRRVADAAARLPGGELVFVNLHPMDLEDEDLYRADAPLSRCADRVVLEITERASVQALELLPDRLRRLRAMGYRLAVDDLGSGFAGLSSFVQLEPDIVKIDASLVRGIDGHAVKQRLVSSMMEVCRDMGIRSVAEGVETADEARALVEAGADLLQGYFFARPGPPFPGVDRGTLADRAGDAEPR